MAPRKRTHLTVPVESERDEDGNFLQDELTKTTNRPQNFQKKDTHYFDESNVKVKTKKRFAKKSFFVTKIRKRKNGPPTVDTRKVFPNFFGLVFVKMHQRAEPNFFVRKISKIYDFFIESPLP